MTWVDVDPNEQRGTWVDVPPGEPQDNLTPVRNAMRYTAGGILKGYTEAAGLPHMIGRAYDALAANYGDTGARNFPGDPSIPAMPIGDVGVTAGGRPPQDPETLPTQAPAPASWLTRHTQDPEWFNRQTYGLLSDTSQQIGGRPIEPYEPTSELGKIGHAGLSTIPTSLVGGSATAVPRIIAGIGGGMGGEAFRQKYPDAPWWAQALASVAGGVTAERALGTVTSGTNYVHGLLSPAFAQRQQEPAVAANIAQNARQSGGLLADTIDQNRAQWTPGARPDLGNVTQSPGVRGMVYQDQTAARAAGNPIYQEMSDATNQAQRAAVAGAQPTDADALLRQAIQGRDAAVGAIAPGVTQQEAGQQLRGNLQSVYDQRVGARAAAGGAPYAALENNPAVVNLTTLRDQTTQLAAQHAGEVGNAYQAAAKQFSSATGLTLDTAAFADSVRKGLGDLEMSYRPGSAAQRAVAQVKEKLDASLKVQVPELADATATWAANSKPLDVFKAAPFGGAIQRDRFGDRYLMDNDTVASSFLRGNGSADALDRLHGVFGNPESATRGLQDYIAGQVRATAVRADGSIDAAAMANALKPFDAAMMRFPTLQRQFSTAAGAQAAVDQRQAYQALYERAGTQLGTGQLDAAGSAYYSPAQFRKFVADNGALIDQAYTPAQAATVRRVNDELQNIAQTVFAKVPGTSGTAQLTPRTPSAFGLHGGSTGAVTGHIMGQVLGWLIPEVGHEAGQAVGTIVGGIQGASREARQAAFEHVRRNALTDPEYAAALLRRYDPSGVNSPAAVRAMQYVIDRTPTLTALSGVAGGAARQP